MRYGIGFAAAALFTVVACEPAATTTLLVKSEPEASRKHSALDEVEVVGGILVDRGFSRERYGATAKSDDAVLHRIEAECGHLAFWMRPVVEGKNEFMTYAHVCVDGVGIRVELSDYPRFTQSRTTKELRAELLAVIPAAIPSAIVEVQ